MMPTPSHQSAGVVRDEPDRLYDWKGKWQIRSPASGSVVVIPMAGITPSHNVSLNDTPLSRTGCERAEPVLVRSGLRPGAKWIQVGPRGNRTLGFISRSVSNWGAGHPQALPTTSWTTSQLCNTILVFSMQCFFLFFHAAKRFNDMKMIESVYRMTAIN